LPVTPERSSDEQPAPSNDYKAIFAEVSERLRIAQQAEGDNRAKAVIDLEFLDGQQWPDDLYNQRKINKRPTLTINHTRTMRMRVVNNMRQQRPRIKVHPVGDGADVDLAKKIGGLIRHIEQRSDGATAYDTGGESAVDIGWGYWRILSEYIDEKSFEQELKLAAIRNTFTVYIDPAARQPAAEDMEWCIISEKMKRTEYRRKFPEQQESEWREGAAGDQGPDWETEDEIRLAEYFRVGKVKDVLVKLTNGDSVYLSDFNKKKATYALAGVQIAKNLKGDEIRRPTERRQIEWYRVNGTTVVQEVDLPGQWIPVIRCEGNVLDLNGQIRRRGMIRDMMDAARMYNYWRTKETEVIALAPVAPWIGTTDHFDGHPEWNDANQKPYSKLTYNAAFLEQPDGSKVPIPPPMRVEPVQIPAGFVNAAESAAKDLMVLAGMPHEPGQDKPGEVVSGKALRERAALSDIGHFQYYDNQTRAIAHTGRVLLDLIPHYYSEARMQRIIGDDGTPEVVGINQKDPALGKIKNDLTVGRYDVVMDTGPGYETKRQEGAEMMIDLMKTPIGEVITKVGADVFLRSLDFAGAQELADRVMPETPQGMKKAMEGLPDQAKNIVQAMNQKLTQAQQLIQTLQLEIKYKGGIAQMQEQAETERHALTEQTKRGDVLIESKTKVHDTLVKAETAKDVALINQAGKIADTHVGGQYDREIAKEAAKATEKADKP
jgi:portal protein